MDQSIRLVDLVRERIRVKNYSIRTEKSYLKWIVSYIRFHSLQHPSKLNSEHIKSYLTHLAVNREVSASTQNQALCALLFLYREVLKVELPYLDGATRAKPSHHVPVVFTQDEAQSVVAFFPPEKALRTCGYYHTASFRAVAQTF